MKILIARQGDNIATLKEYDDIMDRGEISHILIELELIKIELLAMWEEWDKNG